MGHRDAARGAAATFDDLDFAGSAAYIRVRGVTARAPVDIAAATAHHIAIVDSDLRGIAMKHGSRDILIEYNSIHDCDNCVELSSTSNVPGAPYQGATELPPISNVTIRGNRITRPNTDAIFPTNFRNVVVEGNEITGVVENGQHNDVLQTVWGGDRLTFRRNFVHDNGGQGFFIKEAESRTSSCRTTSSSA